MVASLAAHLDDAPPALLADAQLVGGRVGGAQAGARGVGEGERGARAFAAVGVGSVTPAAGRGATLLSGGGPRRPPTHAGARVHVHPPARPVHAQRIALALRHGLEPHDDAPLLAGLDGEDPRAQQPLPHPLHERGVPLAAHDLLVDAPRLLGPQRLAGDHLAVDGELEVLEGGAPGQREQVVGLADQTAAVDEALLDLVAEHAVDQLDAHLAPRALDGRAHGRAARRRDVGARLRTGGDAGAGNDAALRPGGRGGAEEQQGNERAEAGHGDDVRSEGSPGRRRSGGDLHTVLGFRLPASGCRRLPLTARDERRATSDERLRRKPEAVSRKLSPPSRPARVSGAPGSGRRSRPTARAARR